MISINYKDPRPIYEQIKKALKKDILTGEIRKNEKLPSVRDIASELAINPNTIQRAYKDLETEGYIYSVPGKGSFVDDIADLAQKKREESAEKIREVLKDFSEAGGTKEECIEIVNDFFEKGLH